jgi:wyosine [tRNA(Phe)-imidazoG37] synthetase (radical SAM superfamily)
MKDKIKSWLKEKVESLCRKLENNILSNKSLKCKVVLGPVRSRRLGNVLGVNNIKQKACSYNCIYCPSGKTSCCSVCTNYCLSPYELYLSVRKKLEEIEQSGKEIEYIVFAGSGEPTLDSSLSKEISLLREFGYKIAVFTNASLLWNNNIQENLMFADYVSVKIDTALEETWLKINRPHRKLDYNVILSGIKQFSKNFKGTLTTETTFIKNLNDNVDEIEELSKYFKEIKSDRFYFSTPIYPTESNYDVYPAEEIMQQLSEVIKKKIPNSFMLCCPEKDEFFATDDFENELLGLLSLHPINKDAVKNYIKDDQESKMLNKLLKNNSIKEVIHNNKRFYAIENQLQTITNL